jgi:hypothetical protein
LCFSLEARQASPRSQESLLNEIRSQIAVSYHPLNGAEQSSPMAIDKFVKRFSLIEVQAAPDQISVGFPIGFASHVMPPSTLLSQ